MPKLSSKSRRYVAMGTVLIATAGLVAWILTGCAPKVVDPVDATPPPAAESVETDEPTTGSNQMIHPFGETHDYGTGITIVVSEPKEFSPTNIAAGATKPHNIYWEVTITNNSDEPFEPTPFPKVSSGGTTASMIADVDNPVGELNAPPSAPILPGKSLTFLSAYSVTDLNDITYAVAPDFMYDEAIFTNSQ